MVPGAQPAAAFPYRQHLWRIAGGKCFSFFIAEKTRSNEHQPEPSAAEPARQLHRDRRAAVVAVETHARDIQLVENLCCRASPGLHILWIAGFAVAGKIDRERRRTLQNQRVL
jgi:hypothetical protein